MRLNGYLVTFRKSHKVSAVEFDPFVVKLRIEYHLDPHPVRDRVKINFYERLVPEAGSGDLGSLTYLGKNPDIFC